MRTILGAMLLAAACLSHAEWKPRAFVDLNRAGALERLERDNPGHYRMIVQVARAVREKSYVEALKLYRASDDESLQCSSWLWKASFPPKRYVALTLDGVHYALNVAVDITAGRRPANEAGVEALE